MSFSPGDVIDNKYRVIRLIGEGGMGAVYEGENTRISRRVAIKVLRTEAANRPELAARFEREARAAARIGSKYVCDVLDLGDLPTGDSYLVMEFLDGEDLASRLKAGRMPDAEALTVAYQLTDGLATMHEAGIIHRDLKPANVFLSRGTHGRDTVKILDFGVSKFASQQNESLHMTATGAVMGTPLYMSPEQARGAKDIDARSDLYAVGVVLYKAVTGKLPFRGENFNEILFKIALEVPPAVLELAPDVDPAFAEIIERAMAKDPNDRFQTARELNQALYTLGTERGVVLETSVSIPPPGSLTPGKGVTPLSQMPSLPRPSRVPGFGADRVERTMNLPQSAGGAGESGGDHESAAVPLTALHGSGERARRSSMPPAAHMQEIVADGFTSTAWAGNERASSPPTPHSIVSVTAATEHATPHPSVANARSRLSQKLEDENRRAAAKTRKIAFGIVGLLGVAVAGFVVATRINAVSAAAPTTLESAQPVATAPPSAAPQPPASVAGGVDVGALPLANGANGANGAGGNVIPAVQPNALPIIARPGATPTAGAASAPATAATVANAAPAANAGPPAPSASVAVKKSDWGVIAPTVPTIDKTHAPPPEPAP